MHVNVCVFTQNLVEVDLLKRVFGGTYGPHRVGFYWYLTKRSDQLKMLQLIRPICDDFGKLQPVETYFNDLGVTVPSPS